MGVYEKLLAVQSKLKAPKNQYNKFGGFNYRSCEDILEAVKPLLKEQGATLIIKDNIVDVGGRIYVEATAILSDTTSDESLYSKAYARESDSKKGMDASQLTGTASSYARKYALNGLFLIDDTKDTDTNEYAQQQGETKPETIGKKAADTLEKLIVDNGFHVDSVCENYRVKNLWDLTPEQKAEIISIIEKAKNGNNGKAN